MKEMKIVLLSFVTGVLNLFGCNAQNKSLMGHGEKILVIGRHADMLLKVTDMLKQHHYFAIGEQFNDEALATFKANDITAVIIGGGVDEESRAFFHSEFHKLNPKIKMIDAHPQTILASLKAAFPDKI
jgi:hypothetical protein